MNLPKGTWYKSTRLGFKLRSSGPKFYPVPPYLMVPCPGYGQHGGHAGLTFQTTAGRQRPQHQRRMEAKPYQAWLPFFFQTFIKLSLCTRPRAQHSPPLVEEYQGRCEIWSPELDSGPLVLCLATGCLWYLRLRVIHEVEG